MEVELDLRRSARQNLEAYYGEAKRARGKLEAARSAAQETQRLLKELETIAEERKKPVLKLKRKVEAAWYEKFRWLQTSGGFLVIGGRDATQNELLFKKHLAASDIVLHADIAGAPLTIIKSDGKEIPLETIREAAVLAACYSAAWKAGLGAVDVWWVRPEQVSREAKAGEWLPKGAFMIRGTKNWLRKTELRLAIGAVIVGGTARPIAGPVTAVEKRTPLFVTLKPGALTQAQAAKEVLKKLLKAASAEERATLSQLTLEDIQKLLPAGKSALL